MELRTKLKENWKSERLEALIQVSVQARACSYSGQYVHNNLSTELDRNVSGGPWRGKMLMLFLCQSITVFLKSYTGYV